MQAFLDIQESWFSLNYLVIFFLIEEYISSTNLSKEFDEILWQSACQNFHIKKNLLIKRKTEIEIFSLLDTNLHR